MQRKLVFTQQGAEIHKLTYEVDESKPKIYREGHEYKFNRQLLSRERIERKNTKLSIQCLSVKMLTEGQLLILPPGKLYGQYDCYVFEIRFQEAVGFYKDSSTYEFSTEDLIFYCQAKDKVQIPITAKHSDNYLVVIVVGNRNCHYAVRTFVGEKNYKPCIRLASVINHVFPTVSLEKNQTYLDWYRKSRDNNATDWEGERNRFKRILNYSIKNRHEVRCDR